MMARKFPGLAVLTLALTTLAGCAVDPGHEGDDTATDTAALGANHYYLVMFGYQDAQNSAPKSHTFASFVQTQNSAWGTQVVDQVDISWLPAAFTGEVCVDVLHLQCPPVNGHNYSLSETLGFAANGNLTVGYWGPFEVRKDLFDRAKDQANYLNTGASRYIANDFLFHRAASRRRGGALNCIHAVSDMTFFDRTGLNWGFDGSKAVLDNFQPWILNTQPAPGVLSSMGVNTWGMIHNPR